MTTFFVNIFLFFVCLTNLNAQPGWAYKVQGNLNDIDSIQIRKCIEQSDYCYFGAIVIDSTTDLSRLHHLNATPTLSLTIDFKTLPKAFLKTNLDKITTLFLGGEQLEDISNFPIMKNLEELRIGGFQGDTLRFLNKLPKLKVLVLNYTDKLVSIDQVISNNKLERLSINNCKNVVLNNSAFTNLKNLSITGTQSTPFKWEDLVNFEKLEVVYLDEVNFESIPENFPQSLRKINIKNSKTNLQTLNKLAALENIEELNLRNIILIWKKEDEFKKPK